jgi:hypothetical protein
MQCKEIEPLIPFYACEELDERERASVAAHLESCGACRAAAEREARLLDAVMAGQTEPSPMLLASCRNNLTDALDEVAPPAAGAWQRILALLQPPRWLSLNPAWTGGMLLVVGIVLGAQVSQWWNQPITPSGAGQDLVIQGASPISDPGRLNIQGIHSLSNPDSEMPTVELVGTQQQPLTMQGTVNDANMRRILAFVVQNNQRFDSGLRLESVELLKMASQDEDVRTALCFAARNDRNPGVRLKALEALRGLGKNPKVRQTLIDALLHDDNPGVRVEAITALRAVAEEGEGADPGLLDVFRDRMQRDPSTFVRMQSAAAMRQLGSRATY